MSGLGSPRMFTSWALDHFEHLAPEWGWKGVARGMVPRRNKGSLVGRLGVFEVRITPKLQGKGYDPNCRRVMLVHTPTDETLAAGDAFDLDDLCRVLDLGLSRYLYALDGTRLRRQA